MTAGVIGTVVAEAGAKGAEAGLFPNGDVLFAEEEPKGEEILFEDEPNGEAAAGGAVVENGD